MRRAAAAVPVSGGDALPHLIAPGVINHHPVGAILQSWPSASEKASCAHPGKESMTAQALGRLATPPGGWKKVGEKLSFSPRARGGVTYRSASYFSFWKNNTPRAAQEGPGDIIAGKKPGATPAAASRWLQAHQHGIFRRGSVIAGADTGFLKAELFIKGLGGAV